MPEGGKEEPKRSEHNPLAIHGRNNTSLKWRVGEFLRGSKWEKKLIHHQIVFGKKGGVNRKKIWW